MQPGRPRRILHLLSQRPSLTGSGITLDALVRGAAAAGYQQWVGVGAPADGPKPAVADLPASRVHPLLFGAPPLDFPLPGMSDVMPYRSTRFSEMSEGQLDRYRQAWRRQIAALIQQARPDLIHSHHIWLMSAQLKDLAPQTPVVTHCHATGLRQLQLCPHLADEVRRGCQRNDHFVVLHRGHAEQLQQELGVREDQVQLVGAGYRPEIFNFEGRGVEPGALLFVGKLSAAKGLPWLLDALTLLEQPHTLHVVGSGGDEAAGALAQRMAQMPNVVMHGRLDQRQLAQQLKRCQVCVLPSLYEGVPLVLAEALACGCRIVATALPGVMDQLAPVMGRWMELVPLPRLEQVDRPLAEDLPRFTEQIAAALTRSLAAPPPQDSPELQGALAQLSWQGVFQRVEQVWQRCLVGVLD